MPQSYTLTEKEKAAIDKILQQQKLVENDIVQLTNGLERKKADLEAIKGALQGMGIMLGVQNEFGDKLKFADDFKMLIEG